MSAGVSSIYHRGRRDPRPIDEAAFAEGCKTLWHSRGYVVVKAEELRRMPAVVVMALEGFAIGKWGQRKEPT